MAFAIILIILTVASVLFHFLSPWQATDIASNWGAIDTTLLITFIVCGLFFVLICAFMAYVLIRYRHREGNRAHYEPENKKLEWSLIIITSVGICAMLAPGLVVYGDFVRPPRDAAILEVFGEQWRWTFRLPGKDNKLGTSDIRHISFDNPFGVNPEDPDGQDDVLVLSNEIHVPVDQPIKVLLRSKDVLHDFYVPQFRAKMDIVPGSVSYFWFTPTKTGAFEILCAEHCGVGHFNMRGKVVVDEPEAYAAWLSEQPTFAESLTRDIALGLEQQGKQLSESRGCMACHSADGSQSLGPGWQDLYGKAETLVDGTQVVVDDDYLKESIVNPAARVVQGYPNVMVAYDYSEEQLDATIAYIKSLTSAAAGDDGAAAPPAGAAADPVSRGSQLVQQYACLVCHSTDGSAGVGPTWLGLYGSTETLADGSSVTVDDGYLAESITAPNARVVEGYPAIMQAYPLDENDLQAMVEYIKSINTDNQGNL